MTAPIDWGDEPPQPARPVGPHAWAEHYNAAREQAPAGRKLLDQLSDRELVALYERAEQAEAAVERVRAELDRWALNTVMRPTARALDDIRRALEPPKEDRS